MLRSLACDESGWFAKVPASRARQALHEYETRPPRLPRKPLVLLVAEQPQLVLPWKRVEGRLGILRSVSPRVCCLAPLCGRVEACPPEGHALFPCLRHTRITQHDCPNQTAVHSLDCRSAGNQDPHDFDSTVKKTSQPGFSECNTRSEKKKSTKSTSARGDVASWSRPEVNHQGG